MAQNDSSIKEYLREIARYPLLTPEQVQSMHASGINRLRLMLRAYE